MQSSPEALSLGVLERTFLDDFTGRKLLTAEERASLFVAPPRGSLDHRLSVFSAGYVSRLVECLENDYPALVRIGAGPFGALASRYVSTCPPRSYDIGRTGDRLPTFSANDPLTAEMPFLADLARLEWALVEGFIAEDREALAWEEVAGLDSATLVSRPLRVVPGTAIVCSRWPLYELWRCKDVPDEAVSVDLEGAPTRTLVWRSGLELRCRTADAIEARLVALGCEGRSLSELEPEEVDAAGAGEVIARFRGLVEEGLYQAIREPAQPANT